MNSINTKISTWEPITCYSFVSGDPVKRMGRRFDFLADDVFIMLHYDRLEQPLYWKKPMLVYVCNTSICNTSDLFNPLMPECYIDKVFGVILSCKLFSSLEHTFLIATNYPEIMKKYLTRTPAELLKTWINAYSLYTDDSSIVIEDCSICYSKNKEGLHNLRIKHMNINELYPLSNVWVGAVVKNQEKLDESKQILLQVPAVKRFVSVNKMLKNFI